MNNAAAKLDSSRNDLRIYSLLFELKYYEFEKWKRCGLTLEQLSLTNKQTNKPKLHPLTDRSKQTNKKASYTYKQNET